jgi:hypothetical protein
MKKPLWNQLRKELMKRGFSEKGASPNNSVVLDDAYLDGLAISELLDLMVQRREKHARADGGGDSGKENYDDAMKAIEAIKVVIERHVD